MADRDIDAKDEQQQQLITNTDSVMIDSTTGVLSTSSNYDIVQRAIIDASNDLNNSTVQYYDENGQTHMINISAEDLSNLVQNAGSADVNSTITFNNQNYTIVGSFENDTNEPSATDTTAQVISVLPPIINGSQSDSDNASNIRFAVATENQKQTIVSSTGQNYLSVQPNLMLTNNESSNAGLTILKHGNNLVNTIDSSDISHLSAVTSTAKMVPLITNNSHIVTCLATNPQIVANNSILSQKNSVQTHNVGTTANKNATKPNEVHNKSELPPLGSSENPIRIIQQGNQYTPVQQLSPEQLQQIMQVVQNQQLAKTTQQHSSGTSVMFNPETNTRIIYRVIYPNEIHNKSIKSSISQSHRKRAYSGDRLVDESLREERDHRKKIRPRTRSGRISKPPRHMMDDYKHIHRLDWDDDYDDDDGGYSDIKFSQEDAEGVVAEPEILPLKPKNWICRACGRAYIGEANLLRHHSKFPDHVNQHATELGVDNETSNDGETGGDGADREDSASPTVGQAADNMDVDTSRGDLVSETSDVKETYDTVGEAQDDDDSDQITTNVDLTGKSADVDTDARVDGSSNDSSDKTVDKDVNSSNTTEDKPVNMNEFDLPVRRSRGRPRGSTRGTRGRPRGSFMARFNVDNYVDRPRKRKNILRQMVEMSSHEDLVDVVMPRITQNMSLWEFLLLKLDAGSGVDFCGVYRELLALHKHVVKMRGQCVFEATPDEVTANNADTSLFVGDETPLSKSLGLLPTMYKVKGIQDHGQLLFHRTAPEDVAIDDNPTHTSTSQTSVASTQPVKVSVTTTSLKQSLPSAPGIASVGHRSLLRSVINYEDTSKQPSAITTSVTGPCETTQPCVISTQAISEASHGVLSDGVLKTTLTIQPSVLAPCVTNSSSLPGGVRAGSNSALKNVTHFSPVTETPTVVSSKSVMNNEHASHASLSSLTQGNYSPNKSTLVTEITPTNLSNAAIAVNQTRDDFVAVTTTVNAMPHDPQAFYVTEAMQSCGDIGRDVNADSALENDCMENAHMENARMENAHMANTRMDVDENESDLHTDQHGAAKPEAGVIFQHELMTGDGALNDGGNQGTQLLFTDGTTDQPIDDILGGSTIYQTEDGYLLIQRPDGVTLQLQGDRNISMETLQTLLALDAPFS